VDANVPTIERDIGGIFIDRYCYMWDVGYWITTEYRKALPKALP